jgi:hypothetical protein
VKRPGAVVAVVVVCVVLAVAGYVLGTGSRGGARSGSGPGGAPVGGPGAPAPPPPVVFGPVAPAMDPVASAASWLRGFRQQSWTDPAPWSWVARVAPVVTGQVAGDDQASVGAGGGEQWREFVAGRCVSRVSTPAGVIPPEAPRTASTVWVQVIADVTTSCKTGPPPGGPVEHVAATVQLVRAPDGLWRVGTRSY